MGADEFFRSLAREAPPEGLSPALTGLWWGLKGDWERAHALVQRYEQDPACCWVHAWLHRIEGDLGNAGYWYRRAGRPMARGPTEEEGEALVRALLPG